MTIEQRAARIRRELAKAHKEADTLRDVAHQSLSRMAAESANRRESSFAAGMAVLTVLFMVLAAAGVATFTN